MVEAGGVEPVFIFLKPLRPKHLVYLQHNCVAYHVIFAFKEEARRWDAVDLLPDMIIHKQREEIIMSIIQNVSLMMQKYKELNHMSMSELSQELGIPTSSVQCYLKGTSDLRATTIELLAEKMDIPVIEMVSGPAPEQERAETIIRGAKEFADLSEEKQELGIQLFLRLVDLFSEDA